MLGIAKQICETDMLECEHVDTTRTKKKIEKQNKKNWERENANKTVATISQRRDSRRKPDWESTTMVSILYLSARFRKNFT